MSSAEGVYCSKLCTLGGVLGYKLYILLAGRLVGLLAQHLILRDIIGESIIVFVRILKKNFNSVNKEPIA